MNDILQYLLKWSIALAVVFLFYRIALRPLTFYQWNRRYLILYSLVAFLIPFINLNAYVQPQKLQDIALVQYIPTISIDAGVAPAVIGQTSTNPLSVVGLVLLAGSLILLARLVVQWYSLHRIRRHAVRLYHPEATVYHVDENVIPFSFGNAIYVNTSLHTEKELNDIILHEFVHVRQKHSVDIIWGELLCILNWYNPFAWLIRQAIRQNLEFIADQAVLQHGLDKKTYQYHLLKVIGSPQYSIANNFNFSSLKKRIAMMNRLKSAKLHLVKFLFVLPLLAILLVAFRNNEGWYQEIISDTTKRPLRSADQELRLVHLKEFYKINPSVKEVAWTADEEIVIYLKNGGRESYRLRNESEMQNFVSIYKAVPTIISKPFPPAPPTADIEIVDEIEVSDEQAVDEEITIVDEIAVEDLAIYHKEQLRYEHSLAEFKKRNPDVDAVIWRNGQVILRLRNGTVENYRLSDSKDMERFGKRYGELRMPPSRLPRQPLKVIPPPPPSLPEHVRSVETTGNKLVVTLKNGETETYDLDKPAEKAALEKKYGEVITIGELPPAAPKQPAVVKPSAVEVSPNSAKSPVIHLEGSAAEQASVKVIHNDNVQSMYADEIVVHGDIAQWNVLSNSPAKVAYYLNGKRAVQQDPTQIAKMSDVSHMEVVASADVLRACDEENYKAIINIITKDNTYNKSAYLDRESVKAIEASKIKAESVNTLMLDHDNPLDIKVEGVPGEQLEVRMTGGQVVKRNGRYYVRPTTNGNVEVLIYKKENGKLKLIKTRAFRVVQPKTPAQPAALIHIQ